jgi:two-component system response regulator
VHLALLDLNLPRVGSLEVPATIRSSQASRRIPVVILASPKSVHDITRSYQPGANCHLTKTINRKVRPAVDRSIEGMRG